MSDLGLTKKDSRSALNSTPEPPKSLDQIVTSFAQYSGPIPPPNFLTQYEQLSPGIAKRFLEEPHTEAEHRRALEKMRVQEHIKFSKRGQIMAFCLAAGCIFGAFSAICLGYRFEGLGTFIGSVAAFAGIFIYAKKRQQNF